MPERVSIAQEMLANEPPPVLYHYTSLAVLQKMTKEGVLWASDLRYLNDTTEYSLLLDHLDLHICDLMKEADSKREANLAKIREQLKSHKQKENLVACFSAKRDDISQ